MHLQMHHLNWLAILVAAMSTMVVGFSTLAPLLPACCPPLPWRCSFTGFARKTCTSA